MGLATPLQSFFWRDALFPLLQIDPLQSDGLLYVQIDPNYKLYKVLTYFLKRYQRGVLTYVGSCLGDEEIHAMDSGTLWKCALSTTGKGKIS